MRAHVLAGCMLIAMHARCTPVAAAAGPRCLAGFESDPHKRCVMHRSRAKLLAPLEGGLSPTHYPGLSRSISLELGHIFREIGDIKAAAARQQDKVHARCGLRLPCAHAPSAHARMPAPQSRCLGCCR